jgi:hypothetical protein
LVGGGGGGENAYKMLMRELEGKSNL